MAISIKSFEVHKWPSHKNWMCWSSNGESVPWTWCSDVQFSYLPRMISLHQHKTSVSNLKKFCFRCYAYNDHQTINCTKHRDFKICSECSSSNHNWRNCQSLTKKASTALEITRQCLISVPEWKWYNNSNVKSTEAFPAQLLPH